MALAAGYRIRVYVASNGLHRTWSDFVRSPLRKINNFVGRAGTAALGGALCGAHKRAMLFWMVGSSRVNYCLTDALFAPFVYP